MAKATASLVATATTAEVISAKASTKVVAIVTEFAQVKAEITRLEKVKAELDSAIREAFGEATLLTHHGVEVARLDTRERSGVDSDLLKTLYPEAFEATRKTSRYSVIVNIFRK